MTKTIITHASPDFDATAGTWLMIRHTPGFEDAQLEFMAFNAIDRQTLDAADAVIDIGGEYDPERWRFDHHQLPGAASTDTCAAMQTWHWLLANGHDLEYLEPLIMVIYQGDLARTALVGIHAQMSGWKIAASEIGLTLSDYEIYSYGRGILDHTARWLEKKGADRAELEKCVVWKSGDNLVWAIAGGSTGASFAAYEEGARVVVFEGRPIKLEGAHGAQVITYPVGASRAPEWQEPDLGKLVGQLAEESSDGALAAELRRWFRHQAGFFAGRGMPKAPSPQLLEVDIEAIARAVDMTWER